MRCYETTNERIGTRGWETRREAQLMYMCKDRRRGTVGPRLVWEDEKGETIQIQRKRKKRRTNRICDGTYWYC